MTQRAIVGIILGILAFGWTSSVRAASVNFALTNSYDNVADPLLVGGGMAGTAQFYSAAQASNTFVASDIGPYSDSATATVDPVIALDSAFLNANPGQYQLISSAGVGNGPIVTPLPAALPLFAGASAHWACSVGTGSGSVNQLEPEQIKH